eukprot:NODE_2380_length_934_cov_2.972881_g1958_i0.p3 GENE.NODE_2380_length_934_cov_2.972881_g1958_i0~~NODE_2380_length_934_cov_2.972881_g1958_i0.p3  ORF type:complete len:62 (+),score=7.76 NODE_2380_length_934_cov_2.972881_g1958_i0:344-529(+)
MCNLMTRLRRRSSVPQYEPSCDSESEEEHPSCSGDLLNWCVTVVSNWNGHFEVQIETVHCL